MKQLLCTATGLVEPVERPTPALGEGELLIKMLACGVCGTDLMKVYDEATPKPVQLGHEIVGEVVETTTQLFDLGQRVAVAHHAPDFSSHYAKRGSETQDPQFKASNVFPGGFSEFIRVPADLVSHTVFAVPTDMPTERAVFMEPLACCLRALDRVPVTPGDTVLVVGVGAIGLLFVPLLRGCGAAVFADDIREERLAMAKAWGAIIDGDVHQASQGRGADVVILTVVNPETLALALGAVRDGGWIIPFGVKPGMTPSLDLWQMYRREVSLVASYSATPDGLARALGLLARPGFELEKTISHRFALGDAAQGFELLHQAKAAKVLIY